MHYMSKWVERDPRLGTGRGEAMEVFQREARLALERGDNVLSYDSASVPDVDESKRLKNDRSGHRLNFVKYMPHRTNKSWKAGRR